MVLAPNFITIVKYYTKGRAAEEALCGKHAGLNGQAIEIGSEGHIFTILRSDRVKSICSC